MQNYQELISDYTNAKIVDYRDPLNPNNDILITCEHATNALPEGYSWDENDERYFKNEHWGQDIGAYDMGNALAAELKCVFVHSLYSRLLIDVNRSMVSDTLFRRSGDGKEVSLNKDLTLEEEQKRIILYLIPYYEALREISLKVKPKHVISVHSFTPNYQGSIRPMEMGVLCGVESNEFAGKINERYIKKGYNSEINEPYNGAIVMGTVKSLVHSCDCEKKQGITFEYRNDILTDKRRSGLLVADTVEIMKELCNTSN